MNQTEKRLSIINLAISIMDIEAIQLQILRLSVIKTDEKIREILTVLDQKNYIQAQKLIAAYIESPPKNRILQRSQQDEVEHNTLFNIDPQATQNSPDAVNYDALLNLEAEDILPQDISLDMFKNAQTPTEKETDKEEQVLLYTPKEQEKSDTPPETQVEQTPQATKVSEERSETTTYAAIPNIQQKFDDSYQYYRPHTQRNQHFTSVEKWLLQITHEGYSDRDISEMIRTIHSLQPHHPEEAIELLLITAATGSDYAQFTLARSLYKGDLFERNLEEAFKIINHLAIVKSYPQAVCDLGQFYENGIGVTKDKKRAKRLYKEAMELGVERAASHHERLRKQTGLFPLSF